MKNFIVTSGVALFVVISFLVIAWLVLYYVTTVFYQQAEQVSRAFPAFAN